MAASAKALRARGIGGETASRSRPIRPGESADDDARAAELRAVSDDVAELRARAREALERVDRRLDEASLDAIVTSLGRIRAAAQDLKGWALQTGRLLLRLQELAGPGGYKSLAKAGLVAIPESTASNLRTIAQAVADGKVDPGLLPNGVKPAYEVARLEPPVLKAVAERVQLGPDTTVREIKQAATAVRAAALRQDEPDGTGEDAQKRRERLERQIAKWQAELERARQRYGVKIQAAQAELRALNPKRRARGTAAA